MSPEFIAAEMALFARQAREVDIIITTALIPGKAGARLDHRGDGELDAPRLGDRGPRPRRRAATAPSLSPGEVTVHRGVTVIGYVDLPSRLAPTASQLYGSNLTHLLADMGGAKSWHIDLEDPVVRGALVLKEGELMWPPPKSAAIQPKPPPR